MLKLLSAFTLPAAPAFALVLKVPPPASCTPQVNQGLQTLIASKTTKDVDNIMVFGDAVGKTLLQGGGPHGSHHVTTLSVQLPNGTAIHVQVVVNDSLANPGDHIAAYGQGYLTHARARPASMTSTAPPTPPRTTAGSTSTASSPPPTCH